MTSFFRPRLVNALVMHALLVGCLSAVYFMDEEEIFYRPHSVWIIWTQTLASRLEHMWAIDDPNSVAFHHPSILLSVVDSACLCDRFSMDPRCFILHVASGEHRVYRWRPKSPSTEANALTDED
ncbi:hypothetical protein ACFE04_008424 [Oxalis oulophora]